MRRCVYPGSFDPPTLGHLELIERGAPLFDELIVAVLRNPAKKNAFSVERRADMLRRMTAHLPNVRVETFSGLLADYAELTGACAVLRGLRSESDLAAELPMAQLNRMLNPRAETLMMITSPEVSHISSSAVREIASFGGDISALVPECLAAEIAAGLKKE